MFNHFTPTDFEAKRKTKREAGIKRRNEIKESFDTYCIGRERNDQRMIDDLTYHLLLCFGITKDEAENEYSRRKAVERNNKINNALK